ncbi:MAG: hypothetical protein L6R41_006097, partial [Letrouitia leprolyta]
LDGLEITWVEEGTQESFEVVEDESLIVLEVPLLAVNGGSVMVVIPRLVVGEDAERNIEDAVEVLDAELIVVPLLEGVVIDDVKELLPPPPVRLVEEEPNKLDPEPDVAEVEVAGVRVPLPRAI